MNKKSKNIMDSTLRLTATFEHVFSSVHVETLAIGKIVKSHVGEWILVKH